MRDKQTAIFPYMGHFRKQLALEMRRRRGNLTLRDFAKKLGISKTTIQRIESEQQKTEVPARGFIGENNLAFFDLCRFLSVILHIKFLEYNLLLRLRNNKVNT